MNERLKLLRKTLDLTQQQFADRIGIKRNTLATYESGRNEPIDSVFTLICREFRVNEDWLRNGNGEMFIKQTRDEQLADFVGKILSTETDNFKRRFISALSRISESGWDALEMVINELSEINKKD